jgi:hypothetical protein
LEPERFPLAQATPGGAAEPAPRFHTDVSAAGLLQRHSTAPRLLRPDRINVRTYFMVMKKIAASKFKEQCLSMIDHLDADGLVITKHGKPVARILPAERASADLIGALRGRIRAGADVDCSLTSK